MANGLIYRGVTATALTLSPLAGFAADSGFYTADQATQGHMLFNDNCAECHRPDLTGAQGPALKGPAFLARWGGQPLSALYTFEHTQMPLSHPGALSDAEMIPITAYVLSKNDIPAGDTPMAVGAMTTPLPTSEAAPAANTSAPTAPAASDSAPAPAATPAAPASN